MATNNQSIGAAIQKEAFSYVREEAFIVSAARIADAGHKAVNDKIDADGRSLAVAA